MKLLVILFFCFLSLIVNGQDFSLSKKQLLVDYKEYLSILENKHAGIYRYNTKQKFKNFTDSLSYKITDSTSVNEFYNILSSVNAKLRCGHSNIDLPNGWLEKEIFLPISLYSYQGKYFIWHDLTSNGVNIENKELLSINNILIDSIIEKIKPYIPSDGFIETSKNKKVEQLFPLYFAKYFSRQKEYVLDFKGDNENVFSLKLPSRNFNSLIEISKTRYPIDNSIISFNNKSKFFYLKIKSFFMDTIEFKNKIDSVFQVIVNDTPKNIAIDLRGNSGGKIVNEYYLLSYLIENEIETFIKREYKINKKKFQKNTYTSEIISPKNVYFFRNIYFIMDGLTYSAAGEFLSIARHYQLGTFIGEETGAASNGCNAGNKSYTLQFSKFEFNVPDFRYTFEGKVFAKGRGLIPDYPVMFSKEDIVNNNDIALNIINELINGKDSTKQD